MDPTARDRRALIVAQHGLVGDAVGQAMRAVGVVVTLQRWRSSASIPRDLVDGRGLLLADGPEDTTVLGARRWLRARRPEGFEWLVLTGIESGPAWGAFLQAGAYDVLPSTTHLADVLRALEEPDQPAVLGLERRTELIGAWEQATLDSEDGSARLQTLSPREHQVLEQLYKGQSVGRIARSSGVSTATVRSQVKTLLAKLGVSSQLAAVAAYDRTLSLDHPPPA